LTLGASMVSQRQDDQTPKETISVRLVCVSPDALLAGISIPLAAAQAFNRVHGRDSDVYSSVTLIARSASQVPLLEKEVVGAGLRVGEGQATTRRLGRIVRLVSLGLLGFVILLLFLAAALVTTTFYGALIVRSGELRLLSALGATQGFLMFEAVVEAACVGLLGSLIGLLIAWLAGVALDSGLSAAGFAASLPPDRLAIIPSLLATCAGLSASILGASVAVHRVRNQFG
jgi:putative ABC transport system permease protein